MFEPKSLPDSSQSSNGTSSSSDLDQRLGLYRVFLKLYEHHRDLLDEILELENTDARSRTRRVWQYVQGFILGDSVYLTTNLLQDTTQSLVQPQQTWIIGRDRNAGMPLQDKRLSRRHAIIQYVAGEGFYLVDLNSTNGTYINGTPVRRPVLMKDGDRLRLGSLSFIFFLCDASRKAESLSQEVVKQLEQYSLRDTSISKTSASRLESAAPDTCRDEALAGSEKATSTFLHQVADPEFLPSTSEQLSSEQKAEILDRFLNR